MSYAIVRSRKHIKPPVINSNGAGIVATDYWSTPFNAAGLVFCSVDAGMFSVLLPDSLAGIVDEMQSAKLVLVSEPQWMMPGQLSVMEIMWDDGTDTPFSMQLSRRQVGCIESDRLYPAIPKCLVYVRGEDDSPKLAGRWCAIGRVVPMLPWLRPLTDD